MLPACQLRPKAAEHSAKPPVYVRLSAHALEQIALKQPIQVCLVGGQARLVVGDQEYSGVMLPDPGVCEAFVKDGDGFRSAGRVSNRFVLNEGKPVPQASSHPARRAKPEAAHPKSPRKLKPSPKQSSLVHQAALGPVSPAQLSARTSSSVAECRDFLIDFGIPVDEGRLGAGDLFGLNDEMFLYVRPWEHQYSDEERKVVISRCQKALDRQSVGPDHPARKSLKAPPKVKAVRTSSANAGTSTSASASSSNSSSNSNSTSTSASTSSSTSTSTRPTPAVALPKAPIKKRKKEPSPEAPKPLERKASTPPERTSSLVKRKSASTVSSPAKRQKTDVLRLVKKFRSVYTEYLRLYKALESQEQQPPNELERLLSMHKDLAEWKSSIWAASREA